MNTAEAVATATAVLALLGVGGLAGMWRIIQPVLERREAVDDAILGSAPVADKSGAPIAVAQPGLVHRVTTLEETMVAVAEQHTQIAALVSQVASLTQQNTAVQEQLTKILAIVNDNASRIKSLEDGRMERVVTQAAAAKAWEAIVEARKDDNSKDDPKDDPDEVES